LDTKYTIFVADADDSTAQDYRIAAKQIIQEEFPCQWNVLDRHDMYSVDPAI